MAVSATLKQLAARAAAFLDDPPRLTYVFLLIVFLELEESVQRVPTIRLLESAICHQHYRHVELAGDIDESMCKLVPIQAKLARVRGLMSFFDALPGS